MNPICFYHKADLDGVCSAAIVKHFVPECELYGLDYGGEFPWDKVRPGMDAETDPLWMHLFKPENGYKCGDNWETLTGEKRTVYMVDFSLPCEDMQRLAKVSNLTWIDHHGTALEANAGLRARGMRDSTRAACELAWVWMSLFPDPEKMTDSYTFEEFDGDLPEAVRLLGRYDVWDQSDKKAWESKILPFQYAIRAEEGAYDPASKLWPFLFGVNGYSDSMEAYEEAPWKDHAIERGRAILRYQAEVNRRACETGAHEVRLLSPRGQALLSERKAEREKHGPCPKDRDAQVAWLGWVVPIEHDIKWLEARTPEVFRDRGVEPYVLRIIACNTIVFNSQFFDGFFDPEKHDVMCAYSLRSDGKWKVSMYTTKDEIDCGAIAKHFGGDGHKGAAGFVCTGLPWDTE